MAYTHLDTIKAKSIKLSALTGSAGSFLTIELLNIASKKFYLAIKDIVDDEEITLYDEYMTYLETEAYDPSIAFYKMTEDERKYDGLVTAETYLVLAELAFALKKIDKNSVIYDRETFAGDAIDPAMIDSIKQMESVWRKKYSDTLSETLPDEEIYVSGAYMSAI